MVNQFIVQGVNGGLLALILFIWIIVKCFKTAGVAVRDDFRYTLPERFMIWSLGCVMLGHVASFISVSYFDQITIFWYMIIAMIAALMHAEMIDTKRSEFNRLAVNDFVSGPKSADLGGTDKMEDLQLKMDTYPKLGIAKRGFGKIAPIVICSMILLGPMASKAPAMPVELELLSGNYHIWGDIGAVVLDPDGVTEETLFESYNLYSTQLISQDVSFVEDYPISADLMRAGSSIEEFHSNVSAVAHGYPMGKLTTSGSNAYTDATWTFRPVTGHTTNIEFIWSNSPGSRPGFGFSWIHINDLSDGTDLFHLLADYSYISCPGCVGNYQLSLDLDPTHIYSMELFSQANAHDDSAEWNTTAVFRVPEPSTSILLCAGIVLFLFARKGVKVGLGMSRLALIRIRGFLLKCEF
jgi:hypothetical protein